MVDGSYNLHMQGYSYAKTTRELQVFQNLEEAWAWMECLVLRPPGDAVQDDDAVAHKSPSSAVDA